MASWSKLDAELADTLEVERKHRTKPSRSWRPTLVVERAPIAGVCVYCGSEAPADVVCGAHSDLPHFDPVFAAVVTTNTTGGTP